MTAHQEPGFVSGPNSTNACFLRCASTAGARGGVFAGDLLKVAYIYSVRTQGSEFNWKWRSADGSHKSVTAFAYYYDCAEDARKHGYAAEYDRVAGHDAVPAHTKQSS